MPQIHSVSLTTPVHLHIHSTIQSANHVAAAECIQPCRYRARATVNVHQIQEKCDLSVFDRGMDVSARPAGLNI